MLCEKPYYAIIDKDNRLRFLNSEEVKRIENDEITLLNFPRPSPTSPLLLTYKVIKIPCGKCDTCRESLGAEWALRCWLEALQYEHNQFITLTYTPEKEPMSGVEKVHLTKFMHDVRQYFRRKRNHVGIRFFGCGEYGRISARPHYHVLLFNCPPFGDEKFHRKGKYGQDIYISETLNRLWQNGYCSIGTVTKHSIEYVTRYEYKKVETKRKRLRNDEFIHMSRRKGLGVDYLINHLEQIIREDKSLLPNGKKPTIPRYFNRKIKFLIGKKRFENEIVKPRIYRAKCFYAKETERTGLSREEIEKQRINQIKKQINRRKHHYTRTD